MSELLAVAVANNASWCDAVCRSHGYPGTFGSRLWISTRHRLRFYPNAITLVPDATAADTHADQDPSRRYAVKDSFARLDLAPAGLGLRFEADSHGMDGVRLWAHVENPAAGELGEVGYDLARVYFERYAYARTV